MLLCFINMVFTFKFSYEEVNMNSRVKKLGLSVYTWASDPNFAETPIKKISLGAENVFCLNCHFSLHLSFLMGEGVVLAFKYYRLPLVANVKEKKEIKIHQCVIS